MRSVDYLYACRTQSRNLVSIQHPEPVVVFGVVEEIHYAVGIAVEGATPFADDGLQPLRGALFDLAVTSMIWSSIKFQVAWHGTF